MQNADGSPYIVPDELAEGLDMFIQTTANGDFFDALVGGEKLQWEQIYINDQWVGGVLINIPANQSQIDLYYAPAAGANQLTATVVGVEGVPDNRSPHQIPSTWLEPDQPGH